MIFCQRYLIPALVLWCCAGYPISACWGADDSSRILFSQLSEAEGFDADSVSAIAEDERGMIWLATDQGLSRFDGAGSLEFKHDPLDASSLSSNRISSLVFGPGGSLWVGTADAGLNRFDPQTMKAERISLPSQSTDSGGRGMEITSLAITGEQFLWVGTRAGLNILHLQSGKIRSASGIPEGTHVTQIFVDSEESVWAGTESGEFLKWNQDNSKFDRFWSVGVPISAIAAESSGDLWIGTLGQGLLRLDLESGQAKPASLASRDVTSLQGDTNGSLWVGTTEGLAHLDRGAFEFEYYRNDSVDSTSLSDNDVTCLFESRAKVIWVGTESGSASRFGLNRSWFPHYRSNPDLNRMLRLPHESIWSMAPAAGGDLWIGTEMGLTLWSPEKESYMTPNLGAAIGTPYVLAIVKAGDGTVWAGTKGDGLIAMPEGSAGRALQHRHDPENPQSIGHDFVAAVFEDSHSRLWFGTHGAGLWRLGESGRVFVAVPVVEASDSEGSTEEKQSADSARFIAAIAEDHEGRVCVAASDGLYALAPDGSKLLPYHQAIGSAASSAALSGESFSSMLRAEDGSLFVGTRSSGLHRLAPDRGSLQTFRRSNSDLPSDVILGLLEDREGMIWVTTPKGLARLDAVNQQIRRFDDLDGLQQGTLHLNACAKTDDGTLYFGGGQGFHRIDPESLPLPRQPPTPYLIGFERFGEPVIPKLGGILEKSIAATAEIRMPFDRRNRFAFRFANLGTEFPFRGEFRYQLVGFDEVWQIAKNDRKASYPGMSPGEYEFQVQSSIDGQEWNANMARVRLVVTPPWWQTWWARTGFILLFLGAGALVFGLLRRAQITRMKRREQKLKSQRDRAEAQLAVQLQNAVILERSSHSISEGTYQETIFEESLKNLAQHYEVSRCLLCNLEKDDDGEARQLVGIGEYKEGGETAPLDLIIPVEDPLSVEILDSETPIRRENMLAMRTSFQGSQNGVLLIDGSSQPARAWGDVETTLLQSVAAQFGIAIAQRNLTLKEESYRRELEQARRTAEEANQAKSKFLARMTHDLRTPLSAIIGFTRMLQEDETLEGEHRGTIDIINDSGEHLLSLINDILDVSKIEAGKTEVNTEQFELLPLIQGVRQLLAGKVESKGLAFEYSEVNSLPVRVETDRGKLRQILVNLLGNAIKFTDHGSISLKIASQAVDASQGGEGGGGEDGQVRLFFQVSDTGKGIPEKDFDRLFHEFSQTDSGRHAAESTGLGLAIAKSFSRLLGGDIRVASKVGAGTAFEFDILCKEVAATGSEESAPSEAKISMAIENRVITGLAESSPRPRILIADDEKLNRLLITKILGRVGFDLVEAADGGEACEKWRATRPDLILLDENMPVMKGSEVSRVILEESESGQEPVLVSLTANAFDEAREEALEAGFHDFISKPFEKEDLFAKIARHLGVIYTYKDEEKAKSEAAA